MITKINHNIDDMAVYLYYRKSIDKMVLVNTEPDKDWKRLGKDHTSELYLTESIIFDRPIMSLEPDTKQNLVKWAIKIDTRD